MVLRACLLPAFVLALACSGPRHVSSGPPEIQQPKPQPAGSAKRAVGRPPLATPLPLGTDRAEKDPNVFHFEAFEDAGFGKRYGGLDRGENLSVSDDQVFMGARSLRIDYREHGNYGGGFHYKFREHGRAEPEELYGRFYLRFGEDFAPGDGGKLGGPAGTYGRAGWGNRESDGTNGWSARLGYLPDTDPHRVLLRFYTYHARSGAYGESYRWSHSRRGSLERGRWYSVECYVKLNTPGKPDGILRGWIDGELACERNDVLFRTVATLKIEEFWVDHYFGGVDPTPRAMHAHIDNLALSTAPIGEARER
jgi:hypothetical protein